MGLRWRPALDREAKGPAKERARHLLEEEPSARPEHATDLRHGIRPLLYLVDRTEVEHGVEPLVGASIRVASPTATRAGSLPEKPIPRALNHVWVDVYELEPRGAEAVQDDLPADSPAAPELEDPPAIEPPPKPLEERCDPPGAA